MTDETFISQKVDYLLGRYSRLRGRSDPPVDLTECAKLCSVLAVEYRHMIPEGVLTPVRGGFKVFVQDNFLEQPGMKLRQRFTLAHELAHTFFFQLNGITPTPIKESPRPSRLEQLCHLAANQLLIPEVLIKKEVARTGGIKSGQSLLDLASLFEVSLEVMMRRLHTLGIMADDEFAAVLVDEYGGQSLILAACYGSLLSCKAALPKRGLDFRRWVGPLLPQGANPEDSEWTHETKAGTMKGNKVFRSNSSFLLEMRFERPPVGQ